MSQSLWLNSKRLELVLFVYFVSKKKQTIKEDTRNYFSLFFVLVISQAAVPSALDNSTTQGSIISNINAEEPVTPEPSYPVLAPVDCGLPLTPLSCVLVMPSDELIAEGYDSDYQVGPFVER